MISQADGFALIVGFVEWHSELVGAHGHPRFSPVHQVVDTLGSGPRGAVRIARMVDGGIAARLSKEDLGCLFNKESVISREKSR